MSINLQELKAHLDIVQTAKDLGLSYKQRGQAIVISCPDPNHPDKNPSCSVNSRTQKYCCFSCGARGDVIDLLCNVTGKTQAEVIKDEAARLGLDQRTPFNKGKRYSDLKRTVIVRSNMEHGGSDATTFISPRDHIPLTVPQFIEGQKTPPVFNPDAFATGATDKVWNQYKPNKVYPYRSVDGDLMAYVFRIQWRAKDKDGNPAFTSDGKPKFEKFTPQVVYADIIPETAHESGYSYCSFQVAFGAAPFYRWEHIDPDDTKPIVVFEGEKATDYCAENVNQVDAIGWPGGTSNIEDAVDPDVNGNRRAHLDFVTLANRFGHRRFILFPDNDKAGFKAMVAFARQLEAHGVKNVSIVDVAAYSQQFALDAGWDIADREETQDLGLKEIVNWMRAAVSPEEFAEKYGVMDSYRLDAAGKNDHRSKSVRKITVRDVYDDIVDLKELARAFANGPRSDLFDESLAERWKAMTPAEFADFKGHMREEGLGESVLKLDRLLSDRGISPGMTVAVPFKPYGLRI